MKDRRGKSAKKRRSEDAPGGTVATPDQSVVDDLGAALGVPREPDEEFRPSVEILEERDRNRREGEE
jgi:hypothetical protein